MMWRMKPIPAMWISTVFKRHRLLQNSAITAAVVASVLALFFIVSMIPDIVACDSNLMPPDEIENTITLEYYCPEHGAEDMKTHSERVTIRPWMPYVDQMVLVLYMPYGKYEGYVLGAITP